MIELQQALRKTCPMRISGDGGPCVATLCMAWQWAESLERVRLRYRSAHRRVYWVEGTRGSADPSWVAVVITGKHNTGSAKAPEPQRPADVPADWRWSGPEENDWEWAGWLGDDPDEETLHLHRMGRCGLVVENRT